MLDNLYEKIEHTDLFRLISKKNIENLFENIANVKKFCSHQQKFCEDILQRNAEYYSNITTHAYVHWVDETKKEIDGLILANFKKLPHNGNTLEGIESPDQKTDEFIEYRRRVVKAFGDMYKKHGITENAELEIFSVLSKGRGIGKNLIQMWEEDLKARNINCYYLSTNELCDYGYYKHNGYELVDETKISTSDLPSLNNICNSNMVQSKEKDNMNALVFKKVLK